MTVLAHIGDHPALAWRIIEGGDIDRALTRRPAFDERLLSEIDVDESGRPVITPDWDRINFVLQKLAAGLYYLRFRKAPGIGAFRPISLFALNDPPKLVADLSWRFERKEKLTVIQWSVFAYGFCNEANSRDHTYCSINFYDSQFALVACPYIAI